MSYIACVASRRVLPCSVPAEPTTRTTTRNTRLAMQIFERASGIGDKGLAPIHATAAANARRLKRRRHEPDVAHVRARDQKRAALRLRRRGIPRSSSTRRGEHHGRSSGRRIEAPRAARFHRLCSCARTCVLRSSRMLPAAKSLCTNGLLSSLASAWSRTARSACFLLTCSSQRNRMGFRASLLYGWRAHPLSRDLWMQ